MEMEMEMQMQMQMEQACNARATRGLLLTLLLMPCCVWFNFHPSMVITGSSWPRPADSFTLRHTHTHTSTPTHFPKQPTNRVLPQVLYSVQSSIPSERLVVTLSCFSHIGPTAYTTFMLSFLARVL
jgi:hypothetical protein